MSIWSTKGKDIWCEVCAGYKEKMPANVEEGRKITNNQKKQSRNLPAVLHNISDLHGNLIISGQEIVQRAQKTREASPFWFP